MNSYDIAKIHGQMSRAEVDLLKMIVNMTPEKPRIVNIGAGFGTSAAAMLEERPEATIFSVDLQVRPEEEANVIAAGLNPSRLIRILSSSHRAGLSWPFTIDLLFVDGSHSEANVRSDIALWTPKVEDGGFVLFHDYKHRNVPWITEIVDNWAKYEGAVRLGEARYLVGFKV
jgi:predicted O-methyltransferase YrrM